MKKIDWIIILFLLLSSLFLLKDLFIPGFYTSHDGSHQIARFYYFDQAIRDGQIPPRWAQGLYFGFGYPLFTFSYHAPWIIAEIFHMFGVSIIDSVKMTFLAGFFLSGVTMYFFQRIVFGRFAAIVGSFLYLLAPYRFVNIFVRAAIGDATVFIFPPLLFLSLYKLKEIKRFDWRWVSLGAFSFSGMLLSHAMVFFFFFLAASLYILYSLLLVHNKVKFLLYSGSTILFGFLLSAYYFIPSIVERNYTVFSSIMSGAFTGNTFLSLKELLYSPWGYGMMRAQAGGMSFQLGIAQWVLLPIVLCMFLYVLIRRKFKEKNIHREIGFYLLLVLLSFIAMLPISLPLWKLLNSIVVIDFTWRILPLPVFAISVIAGYIAANIRFKPVFAIGILMLALYANRNHTRINQTVEWDVPFFLKLEKTTNSFDEYTPTWVKKELITENAPKVQFLNGKGSFKIESQNSKNLNFSITTPKNDIVRINTIYYPGWEVYSNGIKQTIDYGSGFIEFPVVAGKSHIRAMFTETSLRRFSNTLTLVTFGTLVFMLIRPKKYE